MTVWNFTKIEYRDFDINSNIGSKWYYWSKGYIILMIFILMIDIQTDLI